MNDTGTTTGSTELDRVRRLVDPIASDLDLDLYDVERKGATVRITLDTRPGSPAGISLDTLSLATRLISRELDHTDPIAGRYTLEVTSPGLERPLRTPAHFAREVGKPVTVRLRDPQAVERRVDGTLVAADETGITLRCRAGDLTIGFEEIDKARTVFAWTPAPKPGKGPGKRASTAASTEPPGPTPTRSDRSTDGPTPRPTEDPLS
jgi:ribosome maturation factor RimP